MTTTPDQPWAKFDVGYEGHQRRQARLGLSMTARERLAWLENKTNEMRQLLGKARQGSPVQVASKG
jgi:hypothetical protein